MRRSEADMMHRGSGRMRSVLERAGVLTDDGVGRGCVEPADEVDQRKLCEKVEQKVEGNSG